MSASCSQLQAQPAGNVTIVTILILSSPYAVEQSHSFEGLFSSACEGRVSSCLGCAYRNIQKPVNCWTLEILPWTFSTQFSKLVSFITAALYKPSEGLCHL